MKSKQVVIAGFFSLLGAAHGASIQVSSAQKEIGGTLKTVEGGGTSANYSSATAVGDFAVFNMTKDGADYADLVITYVRDGGGLKSNVMIARTVNSQGLTDNGTVTILLNTTEQLACGGCFRFDWYQPGSYEAGAPTVGSTNLLNDAILYTTFDIDYRQFVAPDKSILDSYGLSSTTQLTAVNVAATDVTPERISFQDSGIDATYTDPSAAAQFLTKSDIPSSHLVGMGKQASDGNALFMFEFRDPSTVLPSFSPVIVAVPEPSSALLLSAALVTGLCIRRRF